jgi:hypothetical protein
MRAGFLIDGESMVTRKTWIGLCGAGVVLVLGAGGYMATTTIANSFDSSKWKALRNSSERDNPRSRMLGDLKKELKPGMTQAEVVALLGEPETKEGARYIYAIGASAFGVDYEYFVVEFDANGKLLRHSITRG